MILCRYFIPLSRPIHTPPLTSLELADALVTLIRERAPHVSLPVRADGAVRPEDARLVSPFKDMLGGSGPDGALVAADLVELVTRQREYVAGNPSSFVAVLRIDGCMIPAFLEEAFP